MVCNLIKCAAVQTSVRNQPCAEEMQLLRNVRQDSTLNTANPGLTKERNVIPCLYRQAERENKTRKREKVIYSRFATGKKQNKVFTLSNNLDCPALQKLEQLC